MATYVLIHGAASDSWYWHRVTPLLEARGHEVVAVDLPCDDDDAAFEEYAQHVVAEIGPPREGIVLVAQSLGGFTAPLVAARVPVDLLVFVAAMIPRAGEHPRAWWESTRHEAERRAGAVSAGLDPDDESLEALFFHDVPRDVVAAAMARGARSQSSTPFAREWPLETWPDVPMRFLLCRDDRFFPAAMMRRLCRERLGIEPDEMSGGHLPALAHPEELVMHLERYRAEVVR